MSGGVPELVLTGPCELSSTPLVDSDPPDELEVEGSDAVVTFDPVDRPAPGSRAHAGARATAIRTRRTTLTLAPEASGVSWFNSQAPGARVLSAHHLIIVL